MKKLRNLIFSIFLLLISAITINVNAATKIQENSSDFTGDVYIIGGTKFDADFALTAPRAITATLNQIELNYQFGYDIEMSTNLYYFSELTGEWYQIPEEGGKVIPVTEEEKEVLEDDLKIFYVNNDVKKLEFTPEIPVVGNLHEEFGVEFKDGKFLVPATQTYFEFTTTNNKEAIVDTKYDEETEDFDLGNLEISGINIIIRAYDYNDRDNLENAEYRNQFYLNEDGSLCADFDSIYQSYDEYAVIEYVDKDGNPIDILNMTFEEGDVVYQKLEKAAFMSYGIQYPTSKIKEKLESGQPVELITDVKLTEDIILDLNGTEQQPIWMNLDLGGHTLSCDENCKRIIRANGKNTTLTITNGIINAGAAQGITVGKQTKESQNVTVNVENSVTINADTYGITVFGFNANLNFGGTINIKNDGYGIAGNGTDGFGGTHIFINEGAVINATHENGFALYLPQEGTVNINGGTLTAATVVGIKSGFLNIDNAILKATGNKIIPVYPTNDGTESTGDVIYVEMNDNYTKNVNITIGENVKFESKNAGNVLVYNSNSTDTPIINYINNNTIDMTYDVNGKPYTRYLSDSEAKISIKKHSNPETELLFTEKSALDYIEKSNESLSIKLLKNLTLNKDLVFDKNNVEITLDLNGKELNCNADCKKIIKITGKYSRVTISNGTINAGAAQGISVGQKTTDEQGIDVTVTNDVTINADTFGITVFGQGANLSFAGTINIKNDGYGIAGNGTAGYGGTNITVNEGAIINATHENGFALYLPQAGTVNIQGGTLTAATVVGIKSGTLNIENATLKATGNKIIPVYPTNDGTESTGDVIYVEMNDNYAKNVSINIADTAVLESENAENILVYNSNSKEIANVDYAKNKTIENTYDANGKMYTRYLSDTEADFEINNKFYKINALYKVLEENSEISELNIKLLKDIALPKDLIFESNLQTINIDLNEKKLSCDGECKRIIRVNGYNNTLNISNGIINAGSAQGITLGQQTKEQQNIIGNISNDVVINADTFGITVFGQGAILNFAGTINIKNDGYGIAGNGTDGFGGTQIFINEGAIINATHEDGFALYLPQAGSTIINGGTLTAASVIGIKAGDLTINGGTLNAIGNKFTALAPTNDGTKSTGDAIFVEINKNYSRNIRIDIMDEAVITSANGNIIQSYKSNIDEDKLTQVGNTLTLGSNKLVETIETNRLSTFN